MYNLEEFLTCATMNCPIILVTGDPFNNNDQVKKTITCINEIDAKDKTFSCWNIQDGKLVLYID